MGRAEEERNRLLLRVRDRLDREYASALRVTDLARDAALSPDHLVRSFRAVFGETPHRYLQRRRIERAMMLLRTTDLPVTEVCLAVGYESLGRFSQRFVEVVGEPPSRYRARAVELRAPGPFLRTWTRPSTHADATTQRSVSGKRRAPATS